MGADTKANTRELVRGPDGLLERLQRRVAPETLRESGSSFGTEVVSPQAAWWRAEVVWCQRALTPQKQTLGFTRGGGALKRGHGAAHKRLAQLGDALCGVFAGAAIIEAAELVFGQTAEGRRSVNGC